MSDDISGKVKKIVADHLGIDEGKSLNATFCFLIVSFCSISSGVSLPSLFLLNSLTPNNPPPFFAPDLSLNFATGLYFITRPFNSMGFLSFSIYPEYGPYVFFFEP